MQLIVLSTMVYLLSEKEISNYLNIVNSLTNLEDITWFYDPLNMGSFEKIHF